MIGLRSRLVVFCLIGVFAIKALELTHHAYGRRLLGLTAAWLLACAIFSFADARYRRV